MIQVKNSEPKPLDEKDRLLIEKGRLLFSQNCEFLLGVTTVEALPLSNLVEIAFAGRSNVGKSSLINALTGRKILARISNTPGRTQQINFFELDNKLMLVDLPGYGYANASKSAIQNWTNLVKLYLKGREQLRRVCLLIDARHGLKESDLNIIRLLDQSAVSYQVILTKCDKTKEKPLMKLLNRLESDLSTHGAAYPNILATSSRKNVGIVELRSELTRLTIEDEYR